MSPQLSNIEAQALQLSPMEREVLAERLLTSVENETLSNIEQAWIEEAEKRYSVYKRGVSQGIPGEQIFRQIREELGWQS